MLTAACSRTALPLQSLPDCLERNRGSGQPDAPHGTLLYGDAIKIYLKQHHPACAFRSIRIS